MDHPSLFHETVEDAAREVIHAAGGPKVVACQLWPDKAPEAAHRLLLACLNEDRQERLSPGHLLMLMRLGRQRGCHALMGYLAGEAGYKADPVEPDDERAQLQRDYIQAVKAMDKITDRMSRLTAEIVAPEWDAKRRA